MLEKGPRRRSGCRADPEAAADRCEHPGLLQTSLIPMQIPSFAHIRRGVCVGNDAKGTFNPKAALSRAQAATMFVRAGWTKAADVAETGEGKTNAEIFNEIKALGLLD